MPEHQQIQQSKKPDTSFQKQANPVIQTPLSNPCSIVQRAKINPKSLTHADIMQLQRTIGNRAVGRLLSSIGSSSTAQQTTVQRQETPREEETCPSCMQRQEIPEEEEPLQGKIIGTVQQQEIPEEEEPLQGKMAETIQRQEIPEEEETLQGKIIGTIQRQEIPEEEEPLKGKMAETLQRQEIPEEEEPLQTKRENNTGMPDNLKAGVENLSGIDMNDVKVHYNSSKPTEVGALAYTQGTNIHVAPGQEKHLPHEAWHVVQQAQGRVKPTMQLKDVAVNDDEGLEREADVMGIKSLRFNNPIQHYLINRIDTKNHLLIQREISDVEKEKVEKFYYIRIREIGNPFFHKHRKILLDALKKNTVKEAIDIIKNYIIISKKLIDSQLVQLEFEELVQNTTVNWVMDNGGPKKDENIKTLYRFSDYKDTEKLRPNLSTIEQYRSPSGTWTKERTQKFKKQQEEQLGIIMTSRFTEEQILRRRMEVAVDHIGKGLTALSPYVSTGEDYKKLALSTDKVMQSIIRSDRHLVNTSDYTDFPKRAGGKQRAPHLLMFQVPINLGKVISPEAVEEYINSTNPSPTSSTYSGQYDEKLNLIAAKKVQEALFFGNGIVGYLVAHADNPY